MKKLLTLLFLCVLLQYGVFAQCSSLTCTTPVPAINAQDACILPNPQALHCYYGGTTPDLPQSFPPTWCTDIDNNHWFAFTATSTLAFFTFTVFGCSEGHSIQVGVLSTADCINFQTITSCTTISDVTSYTIVAPGLSIGQVYYLCIDGTDGALCEYTINGENPSIDVVGGTNNICIPDSPIGKYHTMGVSSWTIDPPSAGTIIGNPVSDFVMVEWLQPGVAEICAENQACANAPVKCYTVVIGGGESEEHVNLCEGKTVTCAGQTFNTPGLYEVHFDNGTNCDSLVKCFVHLIPKDTSTEIHTFCQGDSVACAGKYFSSPGTFPVLLQTPQGCDSLVKCQIHILPVYHSPASVVNLCGPAVFAVCDTSYSISGIFTRNCVSSLGCDSIVTVDLAILHPHAVIAPPDTLGCMASSVITLSSAPSGQNTASGGITSYLWTGPGITGPDNQASVQVDQAGEYCLVLTHSRGALSCSDTVCVMVADSGSLLSQPLIQGDPFPCPGTTSVYTAVSPGSPAPASFTWTIPGNLPFIALAPDTISVAWPDTVVSGLICVTANNICGASQPACLAIMVQTPLQTPQLSGPDQVCAGGGDYMFVLDVEQPGVTYLWTAPAGAVLTGSGDTVNIHFLDAGPAQVCVSSQNACDTGVSVCKTIQVNPAPLAVLNSDAAICPGDSVNLTFVLNGNGPFDLSWSVDNQVFLLDDLASGHIERVSPSQTSVYKLIGISDHSTPVCMSALNDSVTISVRPEFSNTFFREICEGASLFAGGAFQTAPGIYIDSLQTVFGCDSIIVTNLSVLGIDTLILQSTTCDAALAGVFSDTYAQANGCDSVVIRQVLLLPSDTIFRSDKTCDPGNTGVFTQHLANQYGCDSLVITTVTFAESDTTLIAALTCDPSAAGVFYNPLISADGCDSLVITTITLLRGDSTFLYANTCDPGQAGVFYDILATSGGCDSVIVRTVTLSPSGSTNVQSGTCDPSMAGVFVYHLVNQYGCDSTVTETITFHPGSTTTFYLTTCDPLETGTVTEVLDNQWGCDSNIVTITTLLPLSECTLNADLAAVGVACSGNSGSLQLVVTTGASPFTYEIFSGGNAVATGTINASNTTEVVDGLPAGQYTVKVTASNGLETSLEATIQPSVAPLLNASVVSDYKGYAVSCNGSTDGSALATVTGGTAPYSFLWSNGFSGSMPDALGAGSYTVTVVDAVNCPATATLNLAAPEPLSFTLTVNNLNCFGANDGAIRVETAGGIAPYRYSIAANVFQTSNIFSKLDAGAYTVTVIDANDCQHSEIILVNAAIPVNVNLGQDQSIVLGDTTLLQAIVSVPVDSILSVAWTPPFDSVECPECLMQVVAPFISTTYSVKVTALNGCSGTDQVTVIVDRRRDLYVPNVFSPSGSGQNGTFRISAKPGLVGRFKSLRIFDRWGELVYFRSDFLPGDHGADWDGRFDGELLDPGVFVWLLDVEFVDGVTELFRGDVTLLR